MIVTDGVFSDDPDDPEKAVFHQPPSSTKTWSAPSATSSATAACAGSCATTTSTQAAAAEMRTWQHGGGWSIDASVRVADWDRQALERLVRYCARPPLASGRLGRLNDDTLVYRLRRPLLDGRTEILLRPVDLLARLVDLLTPPRKHRHRYCGVLAPAARLRRR